MKKLLAVIFVLAAAYGVWRLQHGGAKASDGRGGQELFYGRAWIDHLPATRNETFHVFGASKADPFGWFAERAIWKGAWERFRYEGRGDGRLAILLPHSGKKMVLSYR